MEHSHLGNEVSELILIDDAIPVLINLLEELSEVVEELFMLRKLKVQNSFLKFSIGQLFMDKIRIHCHSCHQFFSR